MIYIASWNINSITVRLSHLINLLLDYENKRTPIDLICLQEIKTTDEKFPFRQLEEIGYFSIVLGQKSYNGIAILIRKASLNDKQAVSKNFFDIEKNNPLFYDSQQRLLSITVLFKNRESMRFVSIYTPNGESLSSEKFFYKLAWLNALEQWLKKELRQNKYLAILGDYNIAPNDIDISDIISWKGKNLSSKEERDKFLSLLNLGFYDVFRKLHPKKECYTWWDYRKISFERNLGLRIDHILMNEALLNMCCACYVDIRPRSWSRPSDHAPIIALLK